MKKTDLESSKSVDGFVETDKNTPPDVGKTPNSSTDFDGFPRDLDTCTREVLAQIRAIAMADVTGVLTVRDGALTVRSTGELSPEQRAAIASIEKGTGGLKVKFYDKLKALELLGKCLGLFDRPALPSAGENDLLQAIDQSTREVIKTHDLPEVQQTPAAGHDLVESSGS